MSERKKKSGDTLTLYVQVKVVRAPPFEIDIVGGLKEKSGCVHHDQLRTADSGQNRFLSTPTASTINLLSMGHILHHIHTLFTGMRWWRIQTIVWLISDLQCAGDPSCSAIRYHMVLNYNACCNIFYKQHHAQLSKEELFHPFCPTIWLLLRSCRVSDPLRRRLSCIKTIYGDLFKFSVCQRYCLKWISPVFHGLVWIITRADCISECIAETKVN